MGTAIHETTFTVRLKEREEVAERTMAFRMEKPSGFTFKPGQYIDLTLIDPSETDAEGNTRTFSIASAPHESALMVATRLRDSAFKREMQKIPLNHELRIEGPFGNLTMHHNASRPAVLIAGGIGITPFRSMICSVTKESPQRRIWLFLSNRRPEDAPFLGEIQALEKKNPNFKFVGTMTEMEKSKLPWAGEQGLLNREMLSRHLAGVEGAIYYIAGPPGLVAGMQTVLREVGVDEDDIRSEEFAGY